MFKNLQELENLKKLTMKFELHWANEITVIVTLKSFYPGSGVIRMWGVWDMEHSGCGMYRM